MKTGVRIVVLLAVAAACVFAGWQFYQRGSRIIVVFDDAQGLQPGALVRMAGIDIGEVRDLTISEHGVDVAIRLDRAAKERLTANALFVIDPNPDGGKPALVLVKDGAPGGTPLTAQARIRGVNSIILWQLSDLSKQLGQLLDSPPVLDFINNLKEVEREMDEAIRNFDSAAMRRRLEKNIAQLTREFEQALQETDAKQKLEQISRAITRLHAAIARIGDSDEAKRLGQTLDDLGRRVQEELTARDTHSQEPSASGRQP